MGRPLDRKHSDLVFAFLLFLAGNTIISPVARSQA